MTFQFDTSDAIERGEAYGGRCIWPDLSPFVQGMIAGLMEEIAEFAVNMSPGEPLAFHHLSPATLGRLIKDGAAFCAQAGASAVLAAQNVYGGQSFWAARQTGAYPSLFPPLRPFLKDGKIEVEDAA